MSVITRGSLIPSFTAVATGNKTVRLADLNGKNVVLYFYPKDNTPGCTREGQDFRDRYPEFQALNAVILGVSRDGLKSHENFRRKLNFPFDLITDPDEALCDLFGVIKMKNLYGKQVRGIERSTFLIDKRGTLVREWRKVSVEGHGEAVLQALRELENNPAA
jgi:peroxiredoxin Q/BCP